MIRKTRLRSDATHTKYCNSPKTVDFLGTAPAIAEWTYWKLIENQFPYDVIAEKHDLVVPKRKFAKKTEMNYDEIEEFAEKVRPYLVEHYDMEIRNYPKAQSVPDHYHIHVLKLIIEEAPIDFDLPEVVSESKGERKPVNVCISCEG